MSKYWRGPREERHPTGKAAQDSEHRIGIRRFFRHTLQYVPVLNHLAVVVEAEDVDTGPVGIAGPCLVAVQHHVAPLGDDALELDMLARILGGHTYKVVDEGLLAVADVGVVLNVRVARVERDGLGGAALVEHQVVEGDDALLVPLEGDGHTAVSLAARGSFPDPHRSGSTLNAFRSTLNNIRSTLNDFRSTLNDFRSTLNDSRSTLNTFRSTLNTICSKLNNRRSTSNNFCLTQL